MIATAVCIIPGCAALATHGDTCVIHENLRREAYETICHSCQRAIRAGAWFRRTTTGHVCFPKCKDK